MPQLNFIYKSRRWARHTLGERIVASTCSEVLRESASEPVPVRLPLHPGLPLVTASPGDGRGGGRHSVLLSLLAAAGPSL